MSMPEKFLNDGLLGKQNNYEYSVRVLLIFAWPGIPENEKRENYVYSHDIFPTVCDLINIDIPESVEGESLKEVIQNEDKNAENDAGNDKIRDYLYFAYESKVRAVKGDCYKLIVYNTAEGTKKQLFDLKNDPDESNNLYGEAGYEDIAEELKEQMMKYKKEWDDEQHPTGEKFWSEVEL